MAKKNAKKTATQTHNTNIIQLAQHAAAATTVETSEIHRHTRDTTPQLEPDQIAAMSANVISMLTDYELLDVILEITDAKDKPESYYDVIMISVSKFPGVTTDIIWSNPFTSACKASAEALQAGLKRLYVYSAI